MRARPALLLGCLATLIAGMVATVAPAAAGSTAHCGRTPAQGVATYVGPDGGDWAVASSWNTGVVPGDDAGTWTVCVPAGASVVLTSIDGHYRGMAYVQALDVDPTGRLLVAADGKLALLGDRASVESSVGRDSRGVGVLDLRGVLAGPGSLRVYGRMTWAPTLSGASTMTTDWCPTGTGPCQGWAPGRTVVDAGGALQVLVRGVNLWDRRDIVVLGLLDVRGEESYIAADGDTTIDVRSSGRLRFVGNGDLYEGFDGLPALTNAGIVEKYSGTGLSVIAARYSSTGSTLVRDGQLSVQGQVAPTADVRHGEEYATGGCAQPSGGADGCTSPDPALLEGAAPSVAVRLPATTTAYADVTLKDLPGERIPGVDLTDPVHIGVTGETATRTAPMVFKIRIDAADRQGRAPADIEVWRRADGTTTYSRIAPCASTGALVSPKRACVDRRPSVTRELSDGDALVVVRSIVNSRWVGR